MKVMLAAAMLAMLAPAVAAADDALGPEPPPPPPPRPTPFDRGRLGLSAGASTQTALGSHYLVIGAGLAYYVLDGLSIGLAGVHEFGNGPSISRLSLELRYVAQPLVYKWPVVPYVGTFYNHWFIGDDYADVDTVGARAGLMYISGHLVLGLGVVVERTVSACTDACVDVYPDVQISLAL
jgi:hypothetical protein